MFTQLRQLPHVEAGRKLLADHVRRHEELSSETVCLPLKGGVAGSVLAMHKEMTKFVCGGEPVPEHVVSFVNGKHHERAVERECRERVDARYLMFNHRHEHDNDAFAFEKPYKVGDWLST